MRNLLYVCCRDGFQRDNLTQRKTEKKRLSLKSSRKLANSYCLARMYVKHYLSAGNVEVEYVYTHTNHSPGIKEFKHLPLPTSVRKEIQEKFSQGVTLKRIMDGMYTCMHMRECIGNLSMEVCGI